MEAKKDPLFFRLSACVLSLLFYDFPYHFFFFCNYVQQRSLCLAAVALLLRRSHLPHLLRHRRQHKCPSLPPALL